jgi:hypothetical protein
LNMLIWLTIFSRDAEKEEPVMDILGAPKLT